MQCISLFYCEIFHLFNFLRDDTAYLKSKEINHVVFHRFKIQSLSKSFRAAGFSSWNKFCIGTSKKPTLEYRAGNLFWLSVLPFFPPFPMPPFPYLTLIGNYPSLIWAERAEDMPGNSPRWGSFSSFVSFFLGEKQKLSLVSFLLFFQGKSSSFYLDPYSFSFPFSLKSNHPFN